MNFISRTLDAGAHSLPETEPRGPDFEMFVFIKEGGRSTKKKKAPIIPANTPASTLKATFEPQTIYCGEPD